jgi:hypothetical protein
MTVVKICSVCKTEFPATTEYFSKTGKRYLTNRCKQCISLERKRKYAENPEPYKQKTREWAKNNPERKKQQDKDYATKNPERKAVIKRRWAENNHEKKLQAGRDYRKRNPEKGLQTATKWRLLNPDKTTAIKQRRRAKERSLPNQFTAQDWQIALNHFDGRCAVCGRPAGLWHKLAADHWTPITADNCPGTVPGNIIPLCQGQDGCNNSKSNREPIEWLISRVGKQKAQAILGRINRYFESVRRE